MYLLLEIATRFDHHGNGIERTQQQGSKYIFGDKGYFEQNLPKVALVVHFTIDQFLLTGAILWKLGANRPLPLCSLSPAEQQGGGDNYLNITVDHEKQSSGLPVFS